MIILKDRNNMMISTVLERFLSKSTSNHDENHEINE